MTPVSNVDLLPSLLDCAGLPIPPNLDGHNLAPLWRGETKDNPRSERPIFSIYHNGAIRSVRQGRWKLIRHLGAEPYAETAPVSLSNKRGPHHARPPAMLFDLIVDPHELHDLAAEHPEFVTRLTTLLGMWMRETGDPAYFG